MAKKKSSSGGRKSITIVSQPNFLANGKQEGWLVTCGTDRTVCPDIGACQRKLTEIIRGHFSHAKAASATLKVHNSKGALVEIAKYGRGEKGAITVTKEAVKPKSASGSKKPAAKKASTKKSTSKKPTQKATTKPAQKATTKKKGRTAAKKGAAAYHKFIKARRAEGMTQKQAVAAWKAHKAASGTPAKKSTGKKKSAAKASTKRKTAAKRQAAKATTKKKSGSRKQSTAAKKGAAAYHKFIKAQIAAGMTRKQAIAAWKEKKGKSPAKSKASAKKSTGKKQAARKAKSGAKAKSSAPAKKAAASKKPASKKPTAKRKASSKKPASAKPKASTKKPASKKPGRRAAAKGLPSIATVAKS